MIPLPTLDTDAAWTLWKKRCAETPPAAFALYSSLLGGIVTDPALMFVPADDHLVHRGDGVFETVRIVEGALYAMMPHAARLCASAAAIELAVPLTAEELTAATVATARAAGRRDALIRVIVARGPGGYGVSPYESKAPATYIAVYPVPAPFMTKHPGGARVRTSAVPLKPGVMATAKTCNYIPNALMKKEAVDAGVDFTITFDERGCLGEGATENMAIVGADGVLRTPAPERILAGITMTRCAALAAANPGAFGLRGVEQGRISRAEVEAARELLIFGTSIEVVSVVEFDGRPVGDGKPGPASVALGRAFATDMRNYAAWRTAAV
jgi:branched-subunit amino acid aminotransferase/4-amino-4-deoxychorismate lyase